MDTGDSSWIVGLMRHNYEAVGFIPATTIEDRYVRRGQVIFQTNENGKRVGYLLHGPIEQGKLCHVAQHCIEMDKRNRGYGQIAVQELIGRCNRYSAAGIHLRVAIDLQAVEFWKSCGFTTDALVPGGESRNRMIAIMRMNFDLPLFFVR